MEATLDRKSTNNLDILLKAVSEKEVSGKVDTRCPRCNSIIDVSINGTGTKTSCDCGLMNEVMRGI